MRMELEPAVRREVETLVRDFLRYHVEDAYPERSQQVIAQLERLPAEARAPSSPE
jgi:DNA repair protein RecO (recombination protein O)